MKRPAKYSTRKASALREARQAIRRRYTWHLRPPFDAEFDRSHWWEGHARIEPIAALYELARRHPLVAEETPIYATLPGSESPFLPVIPPGLGPRPSLLWTRRLGMRSWPKLTASERTEWKSNLGKLKGFDFRLKESLCRNITALARLAIEQKRAGADEARWQSGPPWFPYYPPAQPTDREWEEAIAQYAVAVHRQGYILLGVALDLAAGNAGAILAAAYRNHLRMYPRPKPRERARCKDWLPIIAEFEEDESRGPKAKAQVFARYRRALDAVSFA